MFNFSYRGLSLSMDDGHIIVKHTNLHAKDLYIQNKSKSFVFEVIIVCFLLEESSKCVLKKKYQGSQ